MDQLPVQPLPVQTGLTHATHISPTTVRGPFGDENTAPLSHGNDPLSRLVHADQLAGEWIRKHPGTALMMVGALYHVGPAALAQFAGGGAPGMVAARGGLHAFRGAIGQRLATSELKNIISGEAGSTKVPTWFEHNKYELKDIFDSIADLYSKAGGQ